MPPEDQPNRRSSVVDRELIALAKQQVEATEQHVAATEISPPPEPPEFVMPPADSFPGYELLRPIHRGGQGVVYQAIQKSTKRKVALKLMREGPFADVREKARFEREVQVLGALQHPNIVTIHDSGLTGGSFYYAMDYISGKPLDQYVEVQNRDRKGADGQRKRADAGSRNRGSKGSRQTLRDRLQLFAKICDAVNAAHLRGIIHRDLKPGNILIDADGEPHVLDFGLAKMATGQFAGTGIRSGSSGAGAVGPVMTITGQFVGSLPWASPEQAEGIPERIDIRTDVYSLGVILFQMLTGEFPYPVVGNMRDVVDNILTAEPDRPSSINRRIDDEVETITLKCLAKERERRYQSAGEIARDMRHYLAGEPIEAKRDSTRYMLRKYLRRYRLQASVAAVIVALITLGFIVSLGLWQRAVRAEHIQIGEREAALGAKRETEQVAAFQAKMLTGIDVEKMGRGLVDSIKAEVRAAMELRGQTPEQVEAHLAALDSLFAGTNPTNIAARSLDENILARAEDAAERQFADQPTVQAQLLQTLADTLCDLGLLDRAMPAQKRALAIRRRTLGDEHPDTLASMNNLSVLLQAQGNPAEAERYQREALDTCRRVLGDDHPDTLSAISSMGSLLQAQGKLTQAEPYLREALEKRRRILGPEHLDTLASITNLGGLLHDQGDSAEAEGHFREALEMSRRVLGGEHPGTLTALNNLGGVLLEQGQLSEAEPYVRESLDTSRRVLGDLHPATLTALNNVASVVYHEGRLDEAEALFRKALEKSRRVLGDEHPDTLPLMSNLAVLLQAQNRLTEAEPYLREALDKARRVLGYEHPNTARLIDKMAELLQAQGKFSEAELLYRELLSLVRGRMPADDPALASALAALGQDLLRQSKFAEAEAPLSECLAIRQQILADGDPQVWLRYSSMSLLGSALAGQGKFADAEPLLLDGYNGMKDDPRVPMPSALGGADRKREALERIVNLYEAWDAAEPDTGKAEKAAEYRALLSAEGDSQASDRDVSQQSPTVKPDRGGE